VRFLQPYRVIRLEPHVDQLRLLQGLPAIVGTGQRDRPLLSMSPAKIMMTVFAELAEAMVLAGKWHAIGSPGQQAAVPHQHRGMPGPGVGIPGQLRRPLHHLLRDMAIVAFQRTPMRLWP
jgi:hypothetical protein